MAGMGAAEQGLPDATFVNRHIIISGRKGNVKSIL
jgi:hypothetical protein